MAAELVEGQQKQVLHHAFCLNCEGEVNAAYPPEDREPSRWQVKVSEEAVTFIIDHPVPADHLKPGFGVREILVFHKDGQWIMFGDETVLIGGRVHAAQP